MQETNPMRQFVNVSLGKALDREFNIRCSGTGLLEEYDSLGIYSLNYNLRKDDGLKSRKSFWIMKPFVTKRKKENGIEIVVNVLGGAYGSSIENVLMFKEFCEFVDDDFAFLQYIATGVVNSDDAARPFRSLLVAAKGEVEEVIGKVSAVEYEPGMLLLADSRERFM